MNDKAPDDADTHDRPPQEAQAPAPHAGGGERPSLHSADSGTAESARRAGDASSRDSTPNEQKPATDHRSADRPDLETPTAGDRAEGGKQGDRVDATASQPPERANLGTSAGGDRTTDAAKHAPQPGTSRVEGSYTDEKGNTWHIDADGNKNRFGADGSITRTDTDGNVLRVDDAGVTYKTADGEEWQDRDDGSSSYTDADGNKWHTDANGKESVTDGAGNQFSEDEGNLHITTAEGESWTITKDGEVVYHGPGIEIQGTLGPTDDPGWEVDKVGDHYFARGPDGHQIKYGGEKAQRDPASGQWHAVSKEAWENARIQAAEWERVRDSPGIAYTAALLGWFQQRVEQATAVVTVGLKNAPMPGLRFLGYVFEAAVPDDLPKDVRAAVDNASSTREAIRILGDYLGPEALINRAAYIIGEGPGRRPPDLGPATASPRPEPAETRAQGTTKSELEIAPGAKPPEPETPAPARALDRPMVGAGGEATRAEPSASGRPAAPDQRKSPAAEGSESAPQTKSSGPDSPPRTKSITERPELSAGTRPTPAEPYAASARQALADQRLAQAKRELSAERAEVSAQRDATIASRGEKAWNNERAGATKELYNRMEDRHVAQMQATFPERTYIVQANIVGIRTPTGIEQVPPGAGRIADWAERRGDKTQLGDIKSPSTITGSVAGGLKRNPELEVEFRPSSKIAEQHANEEKIIELARTLGPDATIVVQGRNALTGSSVTWDVRPDDLLPSRVTPYGALGEN